MSLVVYLDEVEVILAQYQIRPLIGSFKSLLIHQSTVLKDSIVGGHISILIRHWFI